MHFTVKIQLGKAGVKDKRTRKVLTHPPRTGTQAMQLAESKVNPESSFGFVHPRVFKV